MGLNWASNFTIDSVINGYQLSGVSVDGSQPRPIDVVGDLIAVSGVTATQLTYTVESTNPYENFDPSRLFFGVLGDIDGTNYQFPQIADQTSPSRTGVIAPIGRPIPLVAFFGGELIVYSQAASGFRPFFRNLTKVTVTVTVRHKQG